jgi:hypothetical protein
MVLGFTQERLMREVRSIFEDRDLALETVRRLREELRLHGDCVDQWKSAHAKLEGVLIDLVTGWDQGDRDLNPAFIDKVRRLVDPGGDCEVCAEIREESGDATQLCNQCEEG